MGSFDKGECFRKGGQASFCSETFLQQLQKFNKFAKLSLTTGKKGFMILSAAPSKPERCSGGSRRQKPGRHPGGGAGSDGPPDPGDAPDPEVQAADGDLAELPARTGVNIIKLFFFFVTDEEANEVGVKLTHLLSR